jgi:sirohydrochlorin ferrochelatase
MRKFGVMVISHGSRSGKWVRLVDEAVADVHLPAGVPIVSVYLEIVEGRLIQDGIRTLEGMGVTDIVTIPLFVSSGSTHIDEISYALGVIDKPTLPTDMVPFERQAVIHFTSPIDDDPDIARIVYEKVKDLSVDPAKELLLLVGHGSIEKGFHQRWRQGLEQLAARMKELGGFDETDAAMLLPDQIRFKLKLWNKRKPGHRVIVAPLFLSEGYFTKEVIPSRLEGYEYSYNGSAMLPHPLISRWIEGQVIPVLRTKSEMILR